MSSERLQKYIARCGLMSRRKAEQAILDGRVELNGEVVRELGRSLDPEVDQLEVDGKLIQVMKELETYLFYKPRGIMTTKSDDRGRRTVMEFFPDHPSLNPVGRLDFESEGLLLMTHDGDFLLKMTHPRFGVEKVYEVDVKGEWRSEYLEQMVKGIVLEDGEGRFKSIEEKIPGESFVVVVEEGRNRFIRRMFAALNLEVSRLKRTRMGEFTLGELKPGEKVKVQ